MEIGNTSNISFTVTKNGVFTTFEFKDASTNLSLGTFTIKEDRGLGFIQALATMFREIRGDYAEYDKNEYPRARLENKNSGTIEYN